MTILRAHRGWGDDLYFIKADEDVVSDAVETLREEYADTVPEDDRDYDEEVDFIVDGLEQQGFELWLTGLVDIEK